MKKRPELEPQPEAPRNLTVLVRGIEREMFPEFRDEDYGYGSRDSECNFYFAPNHHFFKGLINREVLDSLQQGASLISFGAGVAHLEQLLVEALGVNADQVTLTNKNTTLNTPESLKCHQFDMHGAWPDFGRKFNFAIFPESFTSLLAFKRIHGNYYTESPLTDAVVRLLSRCFEILEEDGEVRVDGHCLREDELYVIQSKLVNEDISITCDKDLLVAKRAPKELSEAEEVCD